MSWRLECAALVLAAVVMLLVISRAAQRACMLTHPDAVAQCTVSP